MTSERWSKLCEYHSTTARKCPRENSKKPSKKIGKSLAKVSNARAPFLGLDLSKVNVDHPKSRALWTGIRAADSPKVYLCHKNQVPAPRCTSNGDRAMPTVPTPRASSMIASRHVDVSTLRTPPSFSSAVRSQTKVSLHRIQPGQGGGRSRHGHLRMAVGGVGAAGRTACSIKSISLGTALRLALDSTLSTLAECSTST